MIQWLFPVGLNLMNILPGKGIALSLRGKWSRLFLKSCGKNLKLSGHVNIYNPERVVCGENVYIGYGTYIGGGDVILNDEVMIGPYCCIVAGNHTIKNNSYRFGSYDFGIINIGRGTWLASHVTITNNVSIGKGCLIAANSVVTSDIPDFCVAGGIPARIISQTNKSH